MYIYPTIGTTLFRNVLSVAVLDSCILTSRCMLPWLPSAPYPALCPCEPLRLVGDMQAVSYGARTKQCSPLLPVSSSQPRSIVERPRSGPMGRVHIYTTIESFLKTAQVCLKNALGRFAPSALPHYEHTLPRLARSTLNELQQNQHEKALLVSVHVQSPSRLALVPCALSMVDLSDQLRC